MLEIQILNGPQKGQSFSLSKGVHRIGRSHSCEITLIHPQISKEHTRIEVYDDRVIISDMGSRNGTFVNGIQIKSHILNEADQISIYDIRLQISPASVPVHTPPHHVPTSMAAHNYSHSPHDDPIPVYPEGAVNEMAGFPPSSDESLSSPTDQKEVHLVERFNKYLEEVALPAMYKLPEMMEVKWAVGVLILAFATIVTLLSAIPATYLLKSSVEKEAQKRAMTIASAMARENRNAVAVQMQTALNIQAAMNEPGVHKALIVSNPDGRILAPASLAGQYASDTPFVYSAMKIQSNVIKPINGNLIGVSIPMKFYNSSTGNPDITANAILLYDKSSIAINSAQTTSLYIQIYAISLLFGFLLLFLVYKMTNHPIEEINKQLDKALKEESPHIESPYQLASIQLMISNINSALNRMGEQNDDIQMNVEYDRSQELTHLVQLIGFGAMGITSHNLSIAAMNEEFEERTGLNANHLLHTSVEEITDQALKLSIKDLIERSHNQPEQMVVNELEITGINYEIVAQPVYGRNAISYYLVVILPRGESEEGAA